MRQVKRPGRATLALQWRSGVVEPHLRGYISEKVLVRRLYVDYTIGTGYSKHMKICMEVQGLKVP